MEAEGASRRSAIRLAGHIMGPANCASMGKLQESFNRSHGRPLSDQSLTIAEGQAR